MGECEVFVCLGFVEIISFLYFFPLAAKLIGPQTGCQFFKNADFFDLPPLKCHGLLKGPVVVFGDGFCGRV